MLVSESQELLVRVRDHHQALIEDPDVLSEEALKILALAQAELRQRRGAVALHVGV